MKLLGFAGPAGVGKTTCSLYIGDVHLSFAKPMKDCLERLFSFSYGQLYTMEGKETVDERYGVTPRLVMQRFATEFVRTTVPNLWLILMEQRIKEYEDSKFVTVDDLRFDDEADLIRRLGGTVIHVHGRAEFRNDHKSEQGITYKAGDLQINNSRTHGELRDSIRRLIHDRLK